MEDRSGAALKPGDRVRLIGTPIATTLRGDTGVISDDDCRWEGYVLVRMDTPATYHHGDGTDEEMPEIVYAPDNLVLLAPPPAARVPSGQVAGQEGEDQ